MTFSSVQKELKASLYERLNSPFIGCFIFSWCMIHYQLIARVLLGNYDIEEKIAFISDSISDYQVFLFKPALFATIFIVINPILSILVFAWQESVKNKKRQIKYKIEGGSLIPLDDYKKLESDSSEKLSKYNSMITSYENKLEKLSGNLESASLESSKLTEEVAHLKTRVINYSSLKHDYEDVKSNLEYTSSELNKALENNALIDEGNRLLAKQIEHINDYFLKEGINKPNKDVILDIPHLTEFSINRLVHEVKEMGFYPIFDGDAKAIKLSVPFYIKTDLIEVLAEKYRADSHIMLTPANDEQLTKASR